MPNLPIKTGHLFIGAAIILGMASIGLFSAGKHGAPKAKAKIETQSIVVPLSPVRQGSILTENDVTQVKWPSAYLPKGDVYREPYQVIGHIAKQDLYPGEPIFLQKIAGGDSNNGLPSLIPHGYRAVTISVSEIKGVAGFVKPGDRVDVLTTYDVPQPEGEAIKKTRTILQDVQVLASAQTMVNDRKMDVDTPDAVREGEILSVSEDAQPKKQVSDKKKNAKADAREAEKQAKEQEKKRKSEEKAAKLVSSVTLAVTPDQVERLTLSEDAGELRLALRPDSDHKIMPLAGQDSFKMLGIAPPPKKLDETPPAPPKLPSSPGGTSSKGQPSTGGVVLGAQVEFIQGDDKTLYHF